MKMLSTDGRIVVEKLPSGQIAVWTGPPDDPAGFALWPTAALEAAREMLALAWAANPPPRFTGVVEHVAISAPAAPGLSARLSFTVGGETIDLLIEWSDLVALSETAAAALRASAASGHG